MFYSVSVLPRSWSCTHYIHTHPYHESACHRQMAPILCFNTEGQYSTSEQSSSFLRKRVILILGLSEPANSCGLVLTHCMFGSFPLNFLGLLAAWEAVGNCTVAGATGSLWTKLLASLLECSRFRLCKHLKMLLKFVPAFDGL